MNHTREELLALVDGAESFGFWTEAVYWTRELSALVMSGG